MSKRAIHPGDILSAELEELGVSATDVAQMLQVKPQHFQAILHGEQAMDAETALRLSRWMGTSAMVWMHLQMVYDLRVTEQNAGAAIRRDVQPHHHGLSGNAEFQLDTTVNFTQRNF